MPENIYSDGYLGRNEEIPPLVQYVCSVTDMKLNTPPPIKELPKSSTSIPRKPPLSILIKEIEDYTVLMARLTSDTYTIKLYRNLPEGRRKLYARKSGLLPTNNYEMDKWFNTICEAVQRAKIGERRGFKDLLKHVHRQAMEAEELEKKRPKTITEILRNNQDVSKSQAAGEYISVSDDPEGYYQITDIGDSQFFNRQIISGSVFNMTIKYCQSQNKRPPKGIFSRTRDFKEVQKGFTASQITLPPGGIVPGATKRIYVQGGDMERRRLAREEYERKVREKIEEAKKKHDNQEKK